MKIKVCGLKYSDNIKAVEALAPDYMGFICYEKSPRFIGGMDDEELINIPTDIIKVGVFVDEDADSISKMIYKYKFDAIQLHGSESPEFCDMYKHEVQVIKAFGVDKHFDFTRLDAYKNNVDYFLLDTKTPVHGGSGMVFDWGVLNKYKLDVPFFLSGGLSLDNLEEIKKIKHSAFYGVDLNSKFELSPALKDISKLKQAFNTINTL
ncbi:MULTISPECIES: phosphoribosylanthranilate isomerase [unclassified Mucilaginibacter]|uniref:phosphoribosylanthranilate isomerase n=1 Tax=unclassified Mucilaginibacter TaxID=2617802 RepID=UPI002AC9DF3B|nr:MULTISPECIES: phosphoribosylanthranilate isomerase [unclassified Mucilaginibacter]MEB0262316.1 phosphoribosylanthranilate isomerase [Mucilaginibacter sp. 10I4]MEB0279963.1 phosphoribosylanthranilate isomerase [Mucilaginibacter sp. 10B2]MEB0301795.1 phosphoribosylanthranilate isomerase [Mucilaginibacter sp. 5C4]WPX21921.1 phosphoribosylanthranilate isomerase [Mucilaginibacter sp. 5C4]